MELQNTDTKRYNEMREVNRDQAKYYESNVKARGNFFTRAWSGIRDRVERLQRDLGVHNDIIYNHRQWLGDLSKKNVLDLGCFSGNDLSVYMAKEAKSYTGIDLSESAISKLRDRIGGIPTATVRAVDFLSSDFIGEWDIVYARSVAHHFKHFDLFLKTLDKHLAPAGVVITLDPLDTSLAVRIARTVYRPLQADREWEWPFRKHTFAIIQSHFDIMAIQGILGYAKWALPLTLISKRLALRVGKRLYQKDTTLANRLGPHLWRCMAVSMVWRKRDSI